MLAGAGRKRRMGWTAWFGVIRRQSFLWHELDEETVRNGGLSGSLMPLAGG